MWISQLLQQILKSLSHCICWQFPQTFLITLTKSLITYILSNYIDQSFVLWLQQVLIQVIYKVQWCFFLQASTQTHFMIPVRITLGYFLIYKNSETFFCILIFSQIADSYRRTCYCPCSCWHSEDQQWSHSWFLWIRTVHRFYNNWNIWWYQRL